MHHIHTTFGFIISSKPYKEAGKVIQIFTRDFGMITAIAQGIRFEKSKLRYHIIDHCFASFSLIQGREYWRVVGANELVNYKIKKEIKQTIFAPLASILRRLLHGEESHPEIFQCLENCILYLKNKEIYSENEILTIESLTIARILNLLGYLNTDSLIGKEKIKILDYNYDLINSLIPGRLEINKKINQALKESHL